jgi:two-component system LytT family sensor kinase
MWPPASPFPVKTDVRLRIAGPIVLFFIGVMFFRLKMYVDTPADKLLNQVLRALLSGYIGWELSRLVALIIQQQLPGLARTAKRLVYLLISVVALSHLLYILRFSLSAIFDKGIWMMPGLLDYSGTTGVVLFYVTVTLGIYEGGYLWKQWQQTIREKEKLVELEWQAKYDLLKAQINPHFLFNSLNSLSSLIADDPQQAEKFTDEMSKVYRYLLRTNNQELVTLATELQFIRSYCRLLSTRYGAGFRVNIQVPDQYQHYLLPSLTLQLLVENAVKHNTVLKDHPLTVTILVNEQEKLLVQNNRQKKSIMVPSHGIGLSNINSKFKLLKQEGIVVQENDEHFTVLVPLIKNC